MVWDSKKIRNKIELISIHIPKTAGTSFRNILKEAYGDSSVARLDIEINDSIVKVNQEELKSKKLSSKIKVIHGHFNYLDLVERFDIPKTTAVITWLRHPVDRVISNYNYLAKRLKEELREKEKGLYILAKMQKSLEEYANLELNRNRMSKFLEGLPLESMKFVGIQEYFVEDLEYFGNLFGINKIAYLEHNITGEKKDTDEDVIRKIEELNALDMALYRKGLELRADRR